MLLHSFDFFIHGPGHIPQVVVGKIRPRISGILISDRLPLRTERAAVHRVFFSMPLSVVVISDNVFGRSVAASFPSPIFLIVTQSSKIQTDGDPKHCQAQEIGSNWTMFDEFSVFCLVNQLETRVLISRG
jgi:hypothetical protein